jgi:hypothetical protein
MMRPAGVSGVRITRPGDAVTRPGDSVRAARPGDSLGGEAGNATFSISFWFQVADFDVFLGFFSLCHFIFSDLICLGCLWFELCE